MSSVSMKHAAGRRTPVSVAPIEADDPQVGTLCLGQGALVDADILKEASRLRALHVEQQAVQASFTDPVPQALLSLFRHAPSPMGEPDVLPRS